MKEKPPHLAGREHSPKDGSSFPEQQADARTIGDGLLAEALDTVRGEWERARRFLDLVAHIIVGLDREGRITMINRTGCRVLGYAEGELLGKDWFATCLPPGVSDEVRRLFVRIVAGTGAFGEYHENPILTRDGGERLIAWHNTVLRDASGRFLGTLSSGEDITERKLAEAALRESEEKFRFFVEHVPAAVAMFDRNMCYLAASRRWITDYNLREQNIIGRSHYEVFPEIPERWKEVHRRCLAGASESCDEDPFVRVDGSLDWVRWAMHPWRRSNNEIGGAIAFTEVITARKTAEVALRESEVRYRQLFDCNLTGVFHSTFEGRILDCNEAFVRTLGYASKEELLSHHAVELYPTPADRERYLVELRQKREMRNYEIELRRRDGSLMWGLENVALVRATDGTESIHGTIIDVTEAKRAEAALRESEERFRLISRLSPVGIYLTTRRGECLYVNDQWCKMTGLTLEEALGMGWVRGLHPDDRQIVLDSWEKMVAARGQWGREYRFQNREGKTTWVYGVAAPQEDSDGNIVEYIGVNVDITERKQAEEALRLRERLLSESQRIGHIGSWTCDQAGRISWTDETYRIYGVSPDTFTPDAESFLNLIHPEDRRAMERWSDACWKGEKSRELEFRTIRSDGTICFLSGRGEMIHDAENKPTYMAGTVQDISERKQAENIIRASRERLAILSRRLIRVQESERQHLARELHDQIGQTLTAVHLCVQQVRNICSEEAQPRLDECARIVDEAIRRTREVSLNLRPAILDDFGLVPALRWYVDQVRRQTDVEFLLDMNLSDYTLPPEQSNACFRVVQEAITNVLRHAQARHAWIELRRSDDQIHLSVRDDGVGCDSETVEPARRTGRSIGLVGMQERVELLGGKFGFRSEKGKGTEVRASIPIASGEKDEEEPVSEVAAREADPT